MLSWPEPQRVGAEHPTLSQPPHLARPGFQSLAPLRLKEGKGTELFLGGLVWPVGSSSVIWALVTIPQLIEPPWSQEATAQHLQFGDMSGSINSE